MRNSFLTLAAVLLVLTGSLTAYASRFGDENYYADRKAGLETLASNGDLLGLRVYLKREISRRPSSNEDRSALNQLLVTYADRAGFDLIYLFNATLGGGLRSSVPDIRIERGDALMAAGHFEEAFSLYQSVARPLHREIEAKHSKNPRIEERALYPFVLHRMARALFASRRYKEALFAYYWIPPSYPRYREALNERAWTAFRLGRADIALGSIDSERAGYFSEMLPARAYVMMDFLYRKLCRQDDVAQLETELKAYKKLLERNGKQALEIWATSDLENRVLWTVANSPEDISSSLVSPSDKHAEKRALNRSLVDSYRVARPKLIESLKSAIGFSQLSDQAANLPAFRLSDKGSSREGFANANMTIWPEDSTEVWADELGKSRFFGESRCGTAGSDRSAERLTESREHALDIGSELFNRGSFNDFLADDGPKRPKLWK